MSTIAINGARVTSGSITFPMFGACAGDLKLADATDLPEAPGALSIVLADRKVTASVIREGSFAASRSTRFVGGFAGWRKTLEPKGYSHLAGVRLASVLGDAAREAGEKITIDTDRALGTHWARERCKAEALLALLAPEWWVDDNGVTQLGPRDSSPIVTPFTVASWSGALGQFEIATETLAPWQPGRTFTANNVSGVQTISSVTIEATNEGKVRLHVLNTDGARERLRADLQSLVRRELASLSFAGVWEYKVAPSIGLPGLINTIDCTPTDDRMPALTNVPIKCIGVVAPPLAGTTCRIQFVNMDPSRPECIGLEGATEHLITAEACALMIYNVLQAITLLNAGPVIGLTLQPVIIPAMLAGLAAQAAPAPPGSIAQIATNAAQAAGMTAGSAPSNSTGPLAAPLAALATKTLDVTGFFPSVGVPNG